MINMSELNMQTLKGDDNVLKSLRLKSSIVKEIERLATNDNRSFTNMVETVLIDRLVKDGILKKESL